MEGSRPVVQVGEAAAALPEISGEYGPYPFNPHTAFQRLSPRVQEEEDAINEETIAESSSFPDHSNEKEAVSESLDEKEAVPESLVENSEFLSVEVVQCDPSSSSTSYFNPNNTYRSLHEFTPGITVDTSTSDDQFTQPQDSSEHPHEDEPISPLRRGDSIRRLLSRSSIGSSRSGSFRTHPSLRSQPSTRSTISRRWSFRRSIRGRPTDLETGLYGPGEGFEPAELESIAAQDMGPFELFSLSREERRELLQPTVPAAQTVPPQRRIIEDLFGRQLCSPQYLGLRRVYMAQLDKKLNTALYESTIANPNPAVWAKPFSYLVGHLGLVSRQLTPHDSVTTFVLSHMTEFIDMIRNGTLAVDMLPESVDEDEKTALALALGFDSYDPDKSTPWHQKIVHEWMLFSLESWTMLDFSMSIDNRHDLLVSHTFCNSTIEELVKPHLPANTPPSYAIAGASPASIARADITAYMLHHWKGIRFKLTQDITAHLRLEDKVVHLYANVAFCQLHAIANTESSLYKAGFKYHHQLLVEIAESYRLLFGADRQSQNYFLTLAESDPCNGFFNIFTLPNCDCEPRMLYNVAGDFPVFGDRLLVLKALLRPTGIRGLWRDKRDSLQWYTFWAVVILGCFGAVVAVLQLGLSALQTWATIKSMGGGSGRGGNGGG